MGALTLEQTKKFLKYHNFDVYKRCSRFENKFAQNDADHISITVYSENNEYRMEYENSINNIKFSTKSLNEFEKIYFMVKYI